MRPLEAYFIWGEVTVTRLDAAFASPADRANTALFARSATRGAAMTPLNELEHV